jgi:hypothetical protein
MLATTPYRMMKVNICVKYHSAARFRDLGCGVGIGLTVIFFYFGCCSSHYLVGHIALTRTTTHFLSRELMRASSSPRFR